MNPPLRSGEDVVEVPEPLTERPPPDRFCDLVLTGGVASGVVYPWAILEIARAFRFKNIGGTSVGAMAAALAAAAEYGRRHGYDEGFEVLRQAPGDLAAPRGGLRTTMLSLFQPEPAGQRLFDLFVSAVDVYGERERGGVPRWIRLVGPALRAFRREALWGGLVGVAAMGAVLALIGAIGGWRAVGWGSVPGVLLALLLGAGAGVLRWGLRHDLVEGLARNGLGLCRGRTTQGRDPDERPGLIEWLDKGIQLAAGLKREAAPLSFRDLWSAPAAPGAPRRRVDEAAAPRERSINLEMITSNVTHGRPRRLPLTAESDALFFRPVELAPYFPPRVMAALVAGAVPCTPAGVPDPRLPHREDGFYELPRADLPVVVAARLSLSFPLLFSAVPLYALDREMPAGERVLKRCWFSDGGLCSNFPVHLFDAALPRWPTFGLWLGRRSPFYRRARVWLPRHRLHGGRDSWQRFDPDDPAARIDTRERLNDPLSFLGRFLLAAATTAKDWQDRSAMRLPTVRNRVARLALRPGEGELHIGMPRKRILRMAHRYGTASGKLFVERFAGAPGAPPAPAWREQRWVRLQALLAGLREFVDGVGDVAAVSAHSVPLGQAIEAAREIAPLADGECLSEAQAAELQALLAACTRLEQSFQAQRAAQPDEPAPRGQLRLRTPL